MADITLSPNMNMPVPNVGVDPGPDWANNLNSCLSILDGHNHSLGTGVQITPSGLNINADLPINGNNIVLMRSVRFSSQSSPLSLASDLGCLYESGVDLYYNDGSGNQIRITQSGSVAGSSGTITGLPSGTASASYSAGTFTFQSATNTAATLDVGSVVIRNEIANGNGVTLSPVTGLAASYGLILPLLPPGQQIMTLDAAGNITAPYTVDNVTITIISNVIGVKAAGITTTQIASNTIMVSNINTSVVGLSLNTGSQQFATAGTFTFTTAAGVSRVVVESTGGGGGGSGGGGVTLGGNGGAGANKTTTIFSGLTPLTGYTVVVGAGGVAGPGSTAGANGGNSSFNGVVVALGADGGQEGRFGNTLSQYSGGFNLGGTGGSSGSGAAGVVGASSSYFVGGTGGNSSGTGNTFGGGGGGASSFGTGGNGGNSLSGFVGSPGNGNGAGGGGGASNGGSSIAGGAGSDGIVNIYW